MTKTKKIKIHNSTVKTVDKGPYRPLVIAGYVLFVLFVVGIFFSTTLPLGKVLFSPHPRHFNVALFMITLTVGSLLPAILGYVIGDYSTKAKERIVHHFNGVLFGLLALWVMLILSTLLWLIPEIPAIPPNTLLVITNMIPSVIVALITVLLTVAHIRSRQAKYDIVQYKPFSLTFIASIIVLPLTVFINAPSISAGLFIPLLLTLVLGSISYATLHRSKLSKLNKVAWAAISVSIAYAAGFILIQFIPSLSNILNSALTADSQIAISSVSLALAAVGWATYWHLQVKALNK